MIIKYLIVYAFGILFGFILSAVLGAGDDE